MFSYYTMFIELIGKGAVAGMNNFEKIIEFDIKINRETVFNLIDCYPNSPIYDEIIEEYKDLEDKVLKLINPQAFFKFGNVSDKIATHSEGNLVEGSSVVYVLMTIGNEIADFSSDFFARGDYLIGMLVNAMADAYLFQMDDSLKDRLMASCIERHYGVAMRLDAPVNIPMIVQKDILDEIKEEESLPIDVTAGYMFTTVKTMGYLLVLTEDEAAIYSGHNCNICSQKNCKMRRE